MMERRTTTVSNPYTVDGAIGDATALLGDVDWVGDTSYSVKDYWSGNFSTQTFNMGKYWYRRYAEDWPIRKFFCDTEFSVLDPSCDTPPGTVLSGFRVWKMAVDASFLVRDGGFEDLSCDRIAVVSQVHAETPGDACLVCYGVELFKPSAAASPDTGAETVCDGAGESCLGLVAGGDPAEVIIGPGDLLVDFGYGTVYQNPGCFLGEPDYPACCS
jgi:hypothetical protein